MKRNRRPTLPGKLAPNRPVDAPAVAPSAVAPPFPVSDRPLAEVVGERFPTLGALVAVIGEDEDRARAEVELRVLGRHRPVFDHGRNSTAWPADCFQPPGWCDHAERDLVCGTCRDYVGEPLPAPCAELVDLGARHGVDLGLDRPEQ